MRMAVESVEGEKIACIWCHEGIIGRDAFDARLLKKWEHREESSESRGTGTGRPYRGDREGGSRPYRPERSSPERTSSRPYGDSDTRKPRAPREHSASEGGEDRPRPARSGWDGKPREKKYFRKSE
jgi:hypothetical protein